MFNFLLDLNKKNQSINEPENEDDGLADTNEVLMEIEAAYNNKSIQNYKDDMYISENTVKNVN